MNGMNTVIRYFDLFSASRTSTAVGRAGSGAEAPSNLWLAGQYAALYLGIIAKLFVDSQARPGEALSLSWTRLVVAGITATAVFPAVYKKSMAASTPGVLQCCVTFATGL